MYWEYLILGLAGFVAGVLNAVAGGGTFITFPVLVWVGIPPVMANATATFSALPGYISSVFAYRRDMQTEGTLGLRATVIVSAIGGLAGAWLLTVTNDAHFRVLVPWLLLIATVLFALGPRIVREMQQRGRGAAGAVTTAVVVTAVSVYGGYFNGGLGIMLLAAFSLLGHTNMHGMNGMKNLLSAVLALVAVVAFIAAGLIAWEAAAVTSVAGAIGGYIGGHQARRIKRTDLLRAFVVLVGAAMTLAFFLL